ncbi:MAG TPA: serine hydrolase domain-containing protein [Thermoanaerobaculia bacterium]|nr:serine hydrolase domain-containing protein [Thermoanaerobaculia bacterium]
MRFLSALLLLTATSLPAAVSDGDLAKRVDAYIAPLAATHDFNGVVLIARGDKVLVRKAYGLADWELNVPMSGRSRFRIASITKTFTAAAISMLVERGKLAYTDPLSRFIPEFPAGEKITIRQLLGHSSGVADPDSLSCSEVTLDDLVKQIAAKPLAFEPGTKSRYSNGGYTLLARVIEVASGLSWQDFLAKEIFAPLALSETTIDRRGPITPMRLHGYVPGPGPAGLQNAPCEGTWSAIGSGSVISSAEDLHRWARSVRNEKPFKRKALEYPFGWGARKYFDRNVIEQSGILSGTASYLAAYLDDDLYVVVLTNVQSGALVGIGKGLAAIALGIEPPRVMPSPPAVASTEGQRKKWLGRFSNPDIAAIEIIENEGSLYQRWGDSRDTVYLMPTGTNTLYNRQDSIALELAQDGTIRMRWPEGEPQVFTRPPP